MVAISHILISEETNKNYHSLVRKSSIMVYVLFSLRGSSSYLRCLKKCQCNFEPNFVYYRQVKSGLHNRNRKFTL